ncbi:aldo/keto reductase [Streptomonospora litoralis]|uniref:General stress protein 69 n=1 Tax=Streptomonospora litoralis TaxID=2498135 RepID=A0A4P6Q5R2_9ACTN|nr:aldo/keto reductase [Streptomonospora litoralis]QBI54117.1 General stress protein 69 [Streptomonospora litoralis]
MRTRTIGTGVAKRQVSSICLGAMMFGTTIDEATSFAILDRFVEAGGTFIDTADAYSFWAPGGRGGESEALLGRWLADRRPGVVVASKLGARPTVPGTGLETAEGLSAAAVRQAAAGIRERLGVETIDLLYTHIEDRTVGLEETVSALADLVDAGEAGILGVSNHATWRLERARVAAADAGRAGCEVLQYRYSYLQPRHDVPVPEAGHVHATPELLDYARVHDLPVLVYSPLISGGYTRPDKPLSQAYDHPGTASRLEALDEVAKETGATRNQVVLAWLQGLDQPVIPLVGASSVGQLDEVLEGADLELSTDQRARMDAAR